MGGGHEGRDVRREPRGHEFLIFRRIVLYHAALTNFTTDTYHRVRASLRRPVLRIKAVGTKEYPDEHDAESLLVLK